MGEQSERLERRTAVLVLVDQGMCPRQAMDLAGVTDLKERQALHLSLLTSMSERFAGSYR